MNSNPYLASVGDFFNALQKSGAPGGTALIPMPQLQQPGGAPAPNASGYPSIADLAGMPPAPPPAAPAALPPPTAPAPKDPLAAPAAPNVNAPVPAGPVAPPAPGAFPNSESTTPGEFPLRQVGGGGVAPAHEVEMRGPTLKAAQNEVAADSREKVGAYLQRGQNAADLEGLAAEDAARAALLRQQAAERAVAEEQAEMQERQRDFDTSSRQLAQFAWKPDGGFWESRSMPQKISALVGIALSGSVTPVGQQNAALVAINNEIDREVRVQENQYRALGDSVHAKQTAFSQAMQKYGDLNAARSLVRTSALDAVQAQMAKTAALWKGTDVQNKADAMASQIAVDRMNQVAQGIRFVLPQQLGRIWVDRNGIRYNEDQARALSGTLRGYEQDREKISLTAAADVIKEGAKVTATKRAEAEQYGPMGKAGAEKLATEKAASQQELNGLSTSIGNAKNHVDEIVAGGTVGNIWAKNSAWVPGATDAIKNVNAREGYNIQARLAVGAAYKLATDSMEPKNLALLEHYAAPYEIHASDNREVALSKMNALQKMLADGAASKGATKPSLDDETKAAITYPGAK